MRTLHDSGPCCARPHVDTAFAIAMTDPIHVGPRALRDALHGELLWRRHGVFSRDLVLESGSDVLAALRWQSVWNREAIGESADGRWLFTRRLAGIFERQVLVRDVGTRADVATFSGRRRHGAVRFTTGVEFKWRRSGFWRPECTWSSALQPRLLAYKSRFGFRRLYDVEVHAAARDCAELPVLMLLGIYLMSLIAARRAH